MSRRIDALAIIKSTIEAGGDPTAETINHYLAILDGIAPETNRPQENAAPPPQPAPGGSVELKVVEIEDRQTFVRVKVSGVPGKRYPMWISSFEADANAIRSAGVGGTVRGQIKDEPDKNGKVWQNLREVTVTARAAGADGIPF